MTRVILMLLTMIQAMFFVNIVLNEGVIFFSIYSWSIVALLSLYISLKAFNTSSSNSDVELNNYLSLTLMTFSVVSIGFIIYLAIFKPFYL